MKLVTDRHGSTHLLDRSRPDPGALPESDVLAVGLDGGASGNAGVDSAPTPSAGTGGSVFQPPAPPLPPLPGDVAALHTDADGGDGEVDSGGDTEEIDKGPPHAAEAAAGTTGGGVVLQ